jgi:hypothetical protein
MSFEDLMEGLSDRSHDAIHDFAANPFPLSWDDFDGMGVRNLERFEIERIRSPLQLLAKFLSLNANVSEFLDWLTNLGIQNPRVLGLKIAMWADAHNLRFE